MCGYCIETAMLDLLEQEVSTGRPDKDEEVSPLFESITQETNFLMHSLKLARKFHMMDEIFYVAHCRAIEEIVHHPHTAMKDGLPQIALIKHLHGYKRFISTRFADQEFVSWLPDPAWMALYHMGFVFSSDMWTEFLSREDLLLESARLLEKYSLWWLQGHEQTKNDLNARMEETGVLDPIEDIAEKDWARFYDFYPALYFAMHYCSRHSPDLPVLKSIALDCPNGVPGFPGYDLWLARKSLVLAIRHYGVDFLLDNISEELPLSRVYYAFLRLESVRNAKDRIIERFNMVLENDDPCGEFRDDVDNYTISMLRFRMHDHIQ